MGTFKIELNGRDQFGWIIAQNVEIEVRQDSIGYDGYVNICFVYNNNFGDWFHNIISTNEPSRNYDLTVVLTDSNIVFRRSMIISLETTISADLIIAEVRWIYRGSYYQNNIASIENVFSKQLKGKVDWKKEGF